METQSIGNWEEFLEKSHKAFKENINMRRDSFLTISDFTIIKTIGKGAYGRVVMAKHNHEKKHYAIKILEKVHVLDLDQLQNTLNEKRILESIDFHFIVRSDHFFQDNCYLYIVMPFVVGGEMFTYLRRLRKLSEHTAAFYAAQIVLALEYLHFLRIVYRDLKPENVLICADGYLKLVDLGYAKRIMSQTYTMCGTVEYLAPEIVMLAGYGFGVDWWTLGVFIYEMCVGKSPFFSRNELVILESIAEGSYSEELLESQTTKDLVRGLLEVNPSNRLGNLGNGVQDIKNHPWFSKINWMAVLNKQTNQSNIQPLLSELLEASTYNTYEEKSLNVCKENIFHEEFSEF